MELETKAIHEGWKPGNGEPRQLPIYESTTFKYDSSEEMGMLFDLEKDGYFYSRLQNPTNDAVAAKLTSMEGGYAGMLTSSGQALPPDRQLTSLRFLIYVKQEDML
mgnify:CR=1 FL=1